MKRLLSCAAVAFLAGSLLTAQDVYQPVPSAANPYQGHGGSAYGAPRPLDDLERTAIAKASDSIGSHINALTSARNELMSASLAVPANPAAMQRAAQALAAAELNLASARADAFARLKTEFRAATPAKLQAIQSALSIGQ